MYHVQRVINENAFHAPVESSLLFSFNHHHLLLFLSYLYNLYVLSFSLSLEYTSNYSFELELYHVWPWQRWKGSRKVSGLFTSQWQAGRAWGISQSHYAVWEFVTY